MSFNRSTLSRDSGTGTLPEGPTSLSWRFRVASARGARPRAFYFEEAVVNGDLGAGWDIDHPDIDSGGLQSEVRAKIRGQLLLDDRLPGRVF